MKKLLKISVIIGILILLGSLLFYYLINLPTVQNWLVTRVTDSLSDKLKTEVHVGRVGVSFFNKLNIEDVYVADEQGDTLLYAKQLFASVRRFQPFKQRIYLNQIALIQPKLNIYRISESNIYNYQFIIDSLIGADNSVDTSNTVYDIRFNSLALQQLQLVTTDSVKERSLSIYLNDLRVNTNRMDLQNRSIVLEDLAVDGLNLYYHDFKSLSKRDTLGNTNNQTAKTVASTIFNPDCWDIRAAELSITNSRFRYDKDSKKRDTRGMDYSHLQVSDISVELKNVRIESDTIFTRIEKFSAKEQCGFEVNKLTANAHLSPVKMEFTDLYILTPNSEITDYYAMEFDQLNDFNDYERKVVMSGDFNKAKVSLKDINYFAKAFPSVTHNTVTLTGQIKGAVNSLRGRNLQIDFGRLSSYQGSITMLGLPKIQETFISLNVDRLRTNLNDLRYALTILEIPKSFDVLGMMNFSGHFDGFVNDFVADGKLRTSIGELTSDINLKIQDSGIAKYSGNFATNRFDLGAWVGNKDLLGTITASTKVNGQGLQLKNLDAEAEGVIESIIIKNYTYRDIEIDGFFTDRRFNGDLFVRDTNLVMDFTGDINLVDSLPVFNLVANIDTANLMALNLTSEPIGLHTNMSLNFTGDRLDNINGMLDISNTLVTRADSAYVFDSLFFQSYDNAEGKVITLRSDLANGWMQGQFSFANLPAALRKFFSYYFISDYRPSPTDTITDQDFVFHIKLEDSKNLTTLVDPDWKHIDGGYLSGFFNSLDNSFSLTSEIDALSYHDVTLNNIFINSGTGSGRVNLTTTVESIDIKDSLLANLLAINASIIKDSVDFLITLEDTSHRNHAHLAGALESNLETLSLGFKNSFLKLRGDRWDISGDNLIYFDGAMLEVSDLRLSNEGNYVNVETQNQQDQTNLALTFKDIRLGEFVPKLDQLIPYDLDGLLNGSVNILNLLKDPALLSNIRLDSFTVDKDLLGNIQATGSYLRRSDYVQTRLIVSGPNKAMLAGRYYLNPIDGQQIDFKANIEQFNIPFIEKFVSKYVSKLNGVAHGNVDIIGTMTEPIFNGDIYIDNGQALVNYLNTLYRFDSNHFTVNEAGIDIGRLKLIDSKGNTALATGQLTHTHLKDFNLSFDIETDNFQFLNTNESSVEGYYGQVYAGGYVFIMGPIDMVEIFAAATTKPLTQFYVSVNESNDVDEYSFYQFIDKDTTKTVNERFKLKNSGVRLNLDIAVTPDAEANLILSEQEGDIITGRGRGNLTVEIDEFGEMAMVGNYEIIDGEYTFSMQNIISKEFDLTRGSQILWTGDPYDARLAMKAVYQLRAAPYDLIEDVLREDRPLQQSKNRVPVFLYLKLNGSLINPDISFDIEVPETDPGIRSALDAKLALIRLDQNELNKQVVGLLVLNRFLPVYPLGSSPNSNIVQGLNNTVSEFVSNQLSIYLSDWISRFVTEVQLNINYRDYQNQVDGTTTGSGTPTAEDEFQRRRELQLALTKSFFNDRIEVDIGGNFDFGESAASANPDDQDAANAANNIAGDFEIRYNITPDGRIKVKVFRKGEYDIFQEQNRNKTGVGIAYRREFDSLKDLAEQNKTRRSNRKQRRKERRESKEKEAAIKEDEP